MKAMNLKDHFEHLRTVHFSLVVTCLALLVVSTTSQDRMLKAAEDQLRALQSIVVHWSELDFDAPINHQVGASSVDLLQPKALALAKSPFTPQAGPYAADFTGPAWSPIASEDCSPWLYDPMIHPVPRILADTHELWDCLHSANAVAIPFAFSGEDAVIKKTKYPLKNAPSLTPVGHIKLVFPKTSEDERAQIRDAFGISIDYAFVGRLYSDDGSSEDVIVPVEKSRTIAVDLVEPLRPLDPGFVLDPGPYKRAFPGLAEITADYEDLTFDKLTAILAAQRKHSDQTFEAFSVKFPSEAIARWGLVLLLGVQLYFLIHMASVEVRPHAEIAVAWIPQYPSLLAQIVFVLSIAVLPPVTTGIIGRVGSITGRRSIDRPLVVLAVCCSAYLAWQTLKLFSKRFSGPLPAKLGRIQLRGHCIF
jgi:hypothetical protein